MWRTELTAGCGGIAVPCLNRAVRMKYNCLPLAQNPGENGDGSTREADINQSKAGVGWKNKNLKYRLYRCCFVLDYSGDKKKIPAANRLKS